MRLFSGLVLMTLFIWGGLTGGNDFDTSVDGFIKKYQDLELPPFQLSYRANLEAIGSPEAVAAQEAFFREQGSIFYHTDRTALTAHQRLELDMIQYEIDMNLERINLEKKWRAESTPLKGSGLAHEVMGKEWYVYFLKRWVDKDLTPEKAYAFGLQEIAGVEEMIEDFKRKHGVGETTLAQFLSEHAFEFKDAKEVQAYYIELRSRLRRKATSYFPHLDKVPVVNIDRGTNPDLARVPGYYSNDTFYYNFFGDTYDGGSTHWMYLHEAIPGHHYQFYLRGLATTGTVREHFSSYCFTEGWGAYVEELGDLLGLYDTPATEYGMLEWNLIRSVRVVLDVGLNYYGWSDEKALRFWRQHIRGKDAIGMREIERMKQWPAQVITYKYGAAVIKQLRGDIPDSRLRDFHEALLAYGDIPLSVLTKHIKS
ncbi:DUF885 domain-containing protein [Robertkochia sediminum]|uniref:DUF885 domain-containing protein n=1 Tax=Robertkochia sediminum TaxID=2785326 RepID=UPI001933E200|nr:DUF885 domain-containing protein [Robertkochia sediminum]MBL7472928.1 DUF885 domain-containing protein [Robertkochia sediminum]